MPWAWSGMSVGYDQWAERRWADVPDRERLRRAWAEGMALCAKAYTDTPDTAWRGRTTEEAADFMLGFRDTLVGLIGMAAVVSTGPSRTSSTGDLT